MRTHDIRKRLEEAEIELRNALAAERAGIAGAGMRRLRAEISADHARAACVRADAEVRRRFGPDDENEGLS